MVASHVLYLNSSGSFLPYFTTLVGQRLPKTSAAMWCWSECSAQEVLSRAGRLDNLSLHDMSSHLTKKDVNKYVANNKLIDKQGFETDELA